MAEKFRIKITLTPIAYRILRDRSEAECVSKSMLIEQLLREENKRTDADGK